jgi:UDP-3-O-[3-hydroxymyristoyl] glucosamine N-acyltransferase
VREVAEWIGAEAPGFEGEVRGVCGIGEASEDAVVFASDAKTLEAAARSRTGLVLASRKLRTEGGAARVLWVEDAKYSFAEVARRLEREERASRAGEIHPSAVIGEGAHLGEGTTVGAHAVIGAGVRIGRECEILSNVTIYPGTTLGDRVVVQSGAVLGSTGFGYVRNRTTGAYLRFPQQGTLRIEDDVEIGANTTIDRGALEETSIGRGTKIDNLVHIAHNCRIGRDVVIAAQTGISGSTAIGDGAVVGGQVGIGDHAEVGEGVILGSGSGVLSGKKLRGPGEVFWGIPAQPLRDYLKDLARLRRGGRKGTAE